MPEKYPRKRDIPVFMISYVVNIGYFNDFRSWSSIFKFFKNGQKMKELHKYLISCSENTSNIALGPSDW